MQCGILRIAILFCAGSIAATITPYAVAKDKAEVKAADANPKAEKKAAGTKKSALRLPPYYGDVINEDQREKIAGAYAKGNTKIAKLKEQLKAATIERDQALEALLTDEQKTKLAKLKEDAKAKRASTAAK